MINQDVAYESGDVEEKFTRDVKTKNLTLNISYNEKDWKMSDRTRHRNHLGSAHHD